MITALERAQLDRVRASLGDWALADIKRAASPEVDLPRLAFIGLAALLDQLSLLYASRSKQGKKARGLNAWIQFVPRYLPAWSTRDDVQLLHDGLRNALLHEYGTRKIALTHATPGVHGQQHGVVRVLNLDDFIAEVDAGFERFLEDLETDSEIRARVLPRTSGLLAPVELAPGRDASVSSSETTTILRLSTAGAIAASATGPAAGVFFSDETRR